ncbi:MAG: DUF1566 domain-containing protein [Deltaproteobacteria bacterium]|nr:DUF1566 domain-containing protein [Deltaproteobacteria bacterium]
MKKRNLIILIFSIILIHCAYPSKEMEEKKYIEIANQRKDTSSSSKVISAKILETDGNFEKYASGIIYDKSANLEWVIGPDKAMSWESARVWVKNLKIDIDHGVWRLPTLNELKTLYKKGRGPHNMSPLFKMSGSAAWTNVQEYKRYVGDQNSKFFALSFKFFDDGHASYRGVVDDFKEWKKSLLHLSGLERLQYVPWIQDNWAFDSIFIKIMKY